MNDRASLDPDREVSKATLLELFPTPVCTLLWPDSDALNAELRRVILARMETSPGVVKTNRGGWQSHADLQDWPEACVQEFVRRARALVREVVRRSVPDATAAHLDNWQMVAWANVNRKGAYNTAHNHYGHGTIWSAFYYVDPGGSEAGDLSSGFTRFQDRSGVPQEILRDPDPFRREVTIVPQQGLMVVFPSPLFHCVDTYEGARLRISIAFNMKHPGFVIPMYPDMEPQGWWWQNFRGFMILPQKVPEKIRAMRMVPGKFFSGRLPRTMRPGPWLERLKAAIDQATAEASAVTRGRDPSAR